jgi:hypothetical protein
LFEEYAQERAAGLGLINPAQLQPLVQRLTRLSWFNSSDVEKQDRVELNLSSTPRMANERTRLIN